MSKRYPRSQHKRLNESVNWEYFEAASRLQSKDKDIIVVYVEGYDDIAFWRDIFDEFENEKLRFEISTPVRNDLAKGKKVVLELAEKTGKHLLLCVDSDFDYLFGNDTSQAKLVNNTPYLIQTFCYSIENYRCNPTSLHSICVKATKNDDHIFDFVKFMKEYSITIYPLLVWYVYSAYIQSEDFFTLADFRNSVRINYLDLENNGESTIEWLSRQVNRRLSHLRHDNPMWNSEIDKFEEMLKSKGVAPDIAYAFMQGHTLFDNVVLILLDEVCKKLKKSAVVRIGESDQRGLTLKNELSYYSNSLKEVRDILVNNTSYKDAPMYDKMHENVNRVIKLLETP